MSYIADMIRNRLSAQDEIVRQIRGFYKGSEGIIALTNEKILFLHTQKGLFTTHYKAVLDLLYPLIKEVVDITSRKFVIRNGNTTYCIETTDIQAKLVVDALLQLIESAKPQTKPITKTVIATAK